jgi:amino acid transporter
MSRAEPPQTGEQPATESAEASPRREVSQLGVFTQSIALIAPSAGLATVAPLVAATSGSAAWLTYLLGTLAVLAVGYAISRLTTRYATSGGLYVLSAKAGGAGSGLMSAWMLVMFCLIGTLSVAIIFGLFISPVLHDIVGTPDNSTLQAIYMFVALLVGLALALRGVRLSIRVMLVLEGISLTLIGILLILATAKHGASIFDHAQLTLKGAHFSSIVTGIVFVFYSFSGFDSASVLGLEARHPKRAISVTMVGSPLIAGLLFVFGAYLLTLGLGTHALSATTNPLAAIATKYHVDWTKNIIGLGVSASLFGSVLALITELGHMLFTLGRERVAPHAFGKLHPRTNTPVFALLVSGAVLLVVLLVEVLAKAANESWYGYLATYTGYTIIIAYLIVSVAILPELRRLGELQARHVVASLVAVVALVYVLYKSAIPIPAYPYNIVLYIFAGAFVAGIVGFLGARQSRSGRLLLGRIGSSLTGDTTDAPSDR